MKFVTYAAVALGCAMLGDAAEKTGKEAVGEYTSSAAMWLWTDKVVYQPGESVVVRWTVKPNNDFYPYTMVAYRQNNQTGARTYLPSNESSVTDMFGNAAGSFSVRRITEAIKATLATLTAPNEPGMHTIVVQLRDFAGGRVVKSVYAKFSVVTSIEDLPSQINADRTLTNDKAWRIRGIVAVRNNATLTIDPGTVLIGMPGSQPPSVLLITTAGKLNASGTRSRPIIMTSSQPVGSRQRGDWGGLILLGKAPINDPGRELSIEGLPELPETKYGGGDANHSCGALRYLRVEFAGALLRPNEETNAITFGGCGKGTVSEYLQAHYGLDDAFEWFGGNNDAKYLVGTYTADDYIDVQIGYTGRIQHAIMVANEDLSNRGVEADNYERDFGAAPRGRLQLWNATFVGNAASTGSAGFDETDAPCLYFRRGAGGVTNNVICYNWTTRALGGANLDVISPLFAAGDFTMSGLVASGNGAEANRPDTLNDQYAEGFRPLAASGNVVFSDPMMARPLERNDPDFRLLPGSPAWGAQFVAPPDDGFFDQWATWAGGMGSTNWTEEWTLFIQEQDMKP